MLPQSFPLLWGLGTARWFEAVPAWGDEKEYVALCSEEDRAVCCIRDGYAFSHA
jgi:hypothetical protein